MDIHKPKAAHSWREFLIEIATIVCGILIALSLEQAVEAYRMHEKIEAAEASIQSELSDQLAYAALFMRLRNGLSERVDGLEAAVLAGDHTGAANLSLKPAPFLMRPWSVAAWDAAASEGIVSRLPPARRRLYEILHRQAVAMIDLEWRIKDSYATLMGARLASAGEGASQVAAAERLRSDIAMSAIVASAMLDEGGRLGLKPTPERMQRGLSDLAACQSAASTGRGDARYVC